MKYIVALTLFATSVAQAGSQTCVLKSGSSPVSKFTVNYEITRDRAALRTSSAVATRGTREGETREAAYLADGEGANFHLTVLGLDEALVMASFGSRLEPFFSVEIEQSGDLYWGFGRSRRGNHEEVSLYECEAFPAEIAAILEAGEESLVSSEEGI